MHLNANTTLKTPRTSLIPYAAHHVPKYHAWMQDTELQQLTASEPLRLEEEYAMQNSWREDGNKLTFVICHTEHDQQDPLHPIPKTIEAGWDGEPVSEERWDEPSDEAAQDREIASMIGDVNLFLVEAEEEDGGDATDSLPVSAPAPAPALIGELEIMIASPRHQNRGLATSALSAFLAYLARRESSILSSYCATSTISSAATSTTTSSPMPAPKLQYLRAKIAGDNEKSIRLFERAGFAMMNGGARNYFGEVEMRIHRPAWEAFAARMVEK